VSDLDRYLVTNRPGWDRLAVLTSRVRRSPRSLAPAEVDEFLRLYQRASSQLSHARGHYGDPDLTTELTALVSEAHHALYRRTASPWSGVRMFFGSTFPGAVWNIRRFVAVAFVVTFLPAAVLALWLANSPEALDVAAPEAVRAAYVSEEFENYYSSAPAAEFATSVLVNNIQVSFLAFALGVTLGVGTVIVLAYNGANIGVALAVFISAGQQSKFWGLVLPHGLLELSAVVIAGAAGLRLGWTIIDPGDRGRGSAFAEEGRRSVAIVLGLVLAFVVAGLIEGYVTPGLPAATRISIGVAVEAAFVVYIVAFGRRSEAADRLGLQVDVA
jgi:uncharacterized membrane protein SpoIIM required for sporulation